MRRWAHFPVAVSALYCHPVEHLLCNLLPAHAGPLVAGAHLSTCLVWYSIAVLNTVNTHSGYHFPLCPSPEAHDNHHEKFNENFGVLGIFDFLYGTDQQFRNSVQFARHVVFFSAPERVPATPDKGARKAEAAACQ